MRNSEVFKSFNGSNDKFSAYGYTCELWQPALMSKPDRHNEIEINYFTEGSLTYLFKDSKITIPAKRITVFWGLVPHQIVDYKGNSPYFVCTIPFSLFLQWNLPAGFINTILSGKVVHEPLDTWAVHDEFLFSKWIAEVNSESYTEIVLLEIRARLTRLALSYRPDTSVEMLPFTPRESNPVEKMIIYITQNYRNPIRVLDVGQAAGVHPDYANVLFKKAFNCNLAEYIIEERISHAQRELITSGEKITEIAYGCGFNSMSSFNAAFLKLNGCTPRDFRKRYHKVSR